MDFKTSSIKLITISLLLSLTTAAHGFSTFGSLAWDVGPNTTRSIGSVGPGGATWSIIGVGISDATGLDAHSDTSTTSLAALNPNLIISNIINDAFDLWASVSGFTNLGQVADSGLGFGANESGSGSFGDIRIGAVNFDGAGGVLAHAFSIDSSASINGDIHIDNEENWVGSFDLATILLHEIGHSLGLGHSNVVGSVLEPFYAGPRFRLSDDDIAGIQSIYGPAPVTTVPLPAAPLLFLSALGLIGFVRRKRLAITS